jgi:hypothetical protein
MKARLTDPRFVAELLNQWELQAAWHATYARGSFVVSENIVYKQHDERCSRRSFEILICVHPEKWSNIADDRNIHGFRILSNLRRHF